MSENQIDSRSDAREVYEKPFIRAMGTVSELTMATSTNNINNFDSGSNPDFYS